MLVVKTKTGPSPIHGTGLFADEFIPKGTVIWKFDPSVDKSYTKEEVEKLPEPERSHIFSLFHSYIDKETGRYVVEGDNARYMNHSDTPNTSLGYAAARDIEPGEELTTDYREFAAEGVDFEIENVSN